MSTSDLALGLYCRPGFMNPGVIGVQQASRVSFASDTLDVARPVVARVIGAYRRAMADRRKAAPSLWDDAAHQHKGFLHALSSGNVDGAATQLANYFRTSLVWGLARQPIGDASPAAFAGHALRTADAVVSLARAAGVLPVASIEQGGVLHQQVVPDTGHGALLYDVERATGLDLGVFPAVASNGGWQFGERATNVDVLVHSYSVLRLQQLGMTPEDSMVEIGGGYGCLAALAAKAGFRRYTVCDLPWVNAIQGYLLIRAFGADAVRLYGEEGPGSISVIPFWSLHDLPRHSVTLAINVNSLPEIGYVTAAEFITTVARISRLGLLSINQEGQAPTAQGSRQLRVWELVRAVRGLRLEARHSYWMEQGYVEELYRPA